MKLDILYPSTPVLPSLFPGAPYFSRRARSYAPDFDVEIGRQRKTRRLLARISAQDLRGGMSKVVLVWSGGDAPSGNNQCISLRTAQPVSSPSMMSRFLRGRDKFVRTRYCHCQPVSKFETAFVSRKYIAPAKGCKFRKKMGC